ncbi:ABC transporter permease [Chitinophagaceae bacterium LB-8]|uniref:ABC transporter permease n=1 Tax=Paraflavisolibacter caeni TaxID=2982496 RepID=A0A9X2XU29_9BACT|nr:ABC transporter permease [Paraflavisolibacter caeni]MCU7548575.1 ABC transporter permease [Paraflavisolibacter caeni]
MFRNYLKTAWRYLLKSKLHSILNIAGLATGMAVALLAGLWVWDELSYNSNFKHQSHLAQVMLNQTYKGETYTGETIAMPLGDALRTQYSGDFKHVSLGSWNNELIVAAGDVKLPSRGMWVQHEFPEMFTLNMVKGRRDVLKDPSFILLSQSLAKALFGKADPINKVVRIDNRLNLSVGGIYEDLPHNSSFYDVKLLLPWGNNENWLGKQTAWSNHCGVLFVQLNEGADIDKTTAKIKNVPTPHIKDFKEEIMLHPFSKLHLYTEFKNGKAVGGRIQLVHMVGVIGFFVLFLACINFMNLSTAKSGKRAKEVGVRKTVGSLRRQLIGQFLGESIFMATLAFLLSIILVQLSLPFFNDLSDKQMAIPWSWPLFWLLAAGLTLITGIVSGSYPAFYLSAFDPIKVLKGVFKAGPMASLPRKVLVVLQFTVSISLIIGTIIVFRQIQYAKSRPAGFARNGLITVPLTDDLKKHFDAIRNDLLQTGAVENMAGSSQPASHFSNNNSIDWKGKDPGLVVYYRNVNVTHDFGKTIGWQIKEGRDFSKSFPSDSGSVILNETGAKMTGLKNPVGELIKFEGKTYQIIGIVKDMLTQSPYEPMEPSIFICGGWMGIITMRIKPTIPVSDALNRIESVFKKYNQGDPLEFKFVDDEYAKKYSNEVRIGNLAAFFAILAIFISCLGLFGLASFIAEQRTKEIGIRKVLGASVFNLWKMQSKEFVGLVMTACLVAVPLAWYFLNDWLQNYQYRTSISWWIFAVTVSGVLGITLLTVSFQAIKASIANPVNSLKTE